MSATAASAQAIGAAYKGRKAGSIGDIGCLSFFPSKNLGAYGDAGMVITNDRAMADRVKMLRVHGSFERYKHATIGMNSRLDNIQAAVLRVKLKYIDGWLEARRQKAAYYNERLKGLLLITPHVLPGNVHIYHLYVLRAKRGLKDIMQFLIDAGIETRTYYPVPLHLQECYKSLGYRKGDLKESEDAADSTFAIPVYPEIKESEMDYIVGKIKEFFR